MRYTALCLLLCFGCASYAPCRVRPYIKPRANLGALMRAYVERDAAYAAKARGDLLGYVTHGLSAYDAVDRIGLGVWVGIRGELRKKR